jgi:hypothetical protein
MMVRWQAMAAEDLAWLLAHLPTRQAQQDFVSLLRYAIGGIPAAAADAAAPHVVGVGEYAIPRWPFLITFQRHSDDVMILRLLPRYGGFAGPDQTRS